MSRTPEQAINEAEAHIDGNRFAGWLIPATTLIDFTGPTKTEAQIVYEAQKELVRSGILDREVVTLRRYR